MRLLVGTRLECSLDAEERERPDVMGGRLLIAGARRQIHVDRVDGAGAAVGSDVVGLEHHPRRSLSGGARVMDGLLIERHLDRGRGAGQLHLRDGGADQLRFAVKRLGHLRSDRRRRARRSGWLRLVHELVIGVVEVADRVQRIGSPVRHLLAVLIKEREGVVEPGRIGRVGVTAPDPDRPQSVDVRVMQPEDRILRRLVGVVHPAAGPADLTVDGVVREVLQLTGRTVEVLEQHGRTAATELRATTERWP